MLHLLRKNQRGINSRSFLFPPQHHYKRDGGGGNKNGNKQGNALAKAANSDLKVSVRLAVSFSPHWNVFSSGLPKTSDRIEIYGRSYGIFGLTAYKFTDKLFQKHIKQHR
jgi:hypothetical protein